MKNKLKKYFTGVTRNTVLLSFSSLFADISTEMLYPILPIFITQTLGAPGSVVGLIEGIAQATQNIVQGISGWFSDKFKNYKKMALIGYFIAAFAKPLMGLSTVWQGVLFSRFLDRFGTGIRSSPRDALVAASVKHKQRGKAFGLEGFGDNLGAFLGPILTLFLLSFFYLDIRYIFYIAVIPGLLAFSMLLPLQNITKTTKFSFKIQFKLKQFSSAYWKFVFASAIFALGNSTSAFLILHVHETEASITKTVLIYAGFNLVSSLISYPAGYFSDLMGRKYIILISFLVFFITYLGFALTKNIYLIALLFIFYGCYQGIYRSLGKALASDLVPQHLQASGMGWYASIIGLLQLIASLVAGILWDNVSHQSVFIYGAIFAFLGSISLLFLVSNKS